MIFNCDCDCCCSRKLEIKESNVNNNQFFIILKGFIKNGSTADIILNKKDIPKIIKFLKKIK